MPASELWQCSPGEGIIKRIPSRYVKKNDRRVVVSYGPAYQIDTDSLFSRMGRATSLALHMFHIIRKQFPGRSAAPENPVPPPSSGGGPEPRVRAVQPVKHHQLGAVVLGGNSVGFIG